MPPLRVAKALVFFSLNKRFKSTKEYSNILKFVGNNAMKSFIALRGMGYKIRNHQI